jgi:beta-phosphoglucomutase-like phosphatase (HAD superfamily)
MSLRGVILDVDGTLVDSNDAHAEAWRLALAEHGFGVPLERLRRLVGMGGDHFLGELDIDHETEPGKSIGRRRGEIFRERFMDGIRPFPCVRELCGRMRDRGLRLGVGSSGVPEEIAVLLRIARVDDLIEVATSGEDAARSKPDPDIIQAAFGELRLAPHEVLLLGDTPYDIMAARRAGVGPIALRCGGWDTGALGGALAVYDDPADLLRRYDESPLGRR